LELKTKRIDIDTYFMLIAKVVSMRATCRHREQGVVLVRGNRIIATGYNGSPPGQPHCIDLRRCIKEEGFECRAEGLHGESNAIASAAKQGISTDGATAYCIYSPCRSCCNLLVSAGIIEVKYLELYKELAEGPVYLQNIGVKVEQVKMSEVLAWQSKQA